MEYDLALKKEERDTDDLKRSGVFENDATPAIVVTKERPTWFRHRQSTFFEPTKPGEAQRIPPPFHPFEYYVTLMDLWDRIQRHRRNSLLLGHAPWESSPGRFGIIADLDSWYAGLPPFVRAFDLDPSVGKQSPIPTTDLKGIGYRMIMFLSAYALLCCPSDPRQDDVPWIASDAFLVAQDHALRSTLWLKCMLDGAVTPQFATGVGFSR